MTKSKKFLFLAMFFAAIFGLPMVTNVANADFEIIQSASADEATEESGEDTEEATADDGATTDEATDDAAADDEVAETPSEPATPDSEEEATADEEAPEAPSEPATPASEAASGTTEPAAEPAPAETPKAPEAAPAAPKKSKLEQAREAASRAKTRKVDLDHLRQQNDADEASLGKEVDSLLERANAYLDLVEKGVTRETDRAGRIKSDRADVKALTDEIEELIRAQVN